MERTIGIQAHINDMQHYDFTGSFVSIEIRAALQDMSVYYDNLDYRGYIKDGIFFIESITNIDNGRPLAKSEVIEMFYVVENKHVLNFDKYVI